MGCLVGKGLDQLADHLINYTEKGSRLDRAFRTVDRKLFLPEALHSRACKPTVQLQSTPSNPRVAIPCWAGSRSLSVSGAGCIEPTPPPAHRCGRSDAVGSLPPFRPAHLRERSRPAAHRARRQLPQLRLRHGVSQLPGCGAPGCRRTPYPVPCLSVVLLSTLYQLVVQFVLQ